jgi:hypothetical protein
MGERYTDVVFSSLLKKGKKPETPLSRGGLLV